MLNSREALRHIARRAATALSVAWLLAYALPATTAHAAGPPAAPPAADSWRDDTLPREIPVAPFRGIWRELDAPDTEDLADYARRAVNAATRMVNPDCDDAVAQVIHVGEHPSVFEVRDGSLININAKFSEALPLLRTMCGSDFNLDVDGRIIGALVAVTGRDGLCYQPVEGRPWAYLDERTRDAGQPYADIFGEGRQLRAYAVWFAHDGNPLWSELAERKAAQMLALAVPIDDALFFRVGRGFTPTDKDPSRGELVPVADVGNYDAASGMTGSPAAYIGGWTPQAGATWKRLTGSETAWELAGGLARYVHRRGALIDDASGRFLADHPAHVTHSLLSGLSYALVAEDREMIKWARAGYDYNLRQKDPGRVGIVLSVDSDQLADMLQLGLLLSRNGAGDYWEDVDRWLRNTFLLMQVGETEVERAKSRPFALRPDPLPPGAWQPEDGCDCCLGAWYATLDNGGQSIGGGCGNSWRALYLAWDSIAEEREDELRVNLLLNRSLPSADIASYLPHEGKVTIHLHAPQQKLLVRIPDWTDFNAVACSLDGAAVDVRWDERQPGYVVLENVQAGQTATIEFPIRQWEVPLELPVSRFVSESGKLACTVTLRANTVIGVSEDVWYPLWKHAGRGEPQVKMRRVRRFVSEERFEF